MSKQSHTPGPWKWTESFETEDGRETFTLVCEKYEYGILSCDGLGNSPQSLGPQGEADAKLIVAAPELLEALKGMLEVYGGQYNDDCLPKSSTELELIQQARSAIAKATA